MEKQTLLNIVQFLDRVQLSGNEALAWTDAYMAIQKELSKYEQPFNDGKVG